LYETPDGTNLTSCELLNGVLKPTHKVIQLDFQNRLETFWTGDSVHLNLLKPSHADSIRLANCLKLSGCDSIVLNLFKIR
jgi:hypothetical protein